nr:CoA-binding protein [Desulfobulbaceae bacterium]
MLKQFTVVDYGKILKAMRSVAVVGLSPKATRPSHQVAQYLLDHGYTVIPVNPGHDTILGLTCYPDLQSIPGHIDVVDIFRNLNDVPGIVDSAIAVGAKTVWMQLGVVHEAAAAKARSAGLTVVMDRCLKIDHQNLFGG